MSDHSRLDQPSAWVRRFAPLVPPGEVLDIACGHGRHARLFAGLGHAVLAADRDALALAMLAAGETGIGTMQVDLENGTVWPFASCRFSGIVMTNYLHRPLFPHISASLAAGGIFIAETFAQGNERFGKPSNPDFLLAPGELLQVAQACAESPLRVIAFEDGYVELPKPAMIQRICLTKLAVGDAAAEFGCFALGDGAPAPIAFAAR
jgi:SAM-dependent methyltransferase